MIFYAGIGSRETPPAILRLMTSTAMRLERYGLVLRSGGARGADQAFERGVVSAKQIFTPDNTRGGNTWARATELARQVHPAWNRCSSYARDLHTRNGFQVLGESLREPSSFVVCWTKDGQATGGTGQALRLANFYGIGIYNLHDNNVRDMFERTDDSEFGEKLLMTALLL